jgi:hypothetical protein
MKNAKYSEAEAEQRFLYFMGLNSISIAIVFSSDFLYSIALQLLGTKLGTSLSFIIGISAFLILIYSFVEGIANGLDMRKRSFWMFKYEDEFNKEISNKSYEVAFSATMIFTMLVFVLSHEKSNFLEQTQLSLHHFIGFVISIASLAYGLSVVTLIHRNHE